VEEELTLRTTEMAAARARSRNESPDARSAEEVPATVRGRKEPAWLHTVVTRTDEPKGAQVNNTDPAEEILTRPSIWRRFLSCATSRDIWSDACWVC
jgi:hypothetical protein